MTTGLERCRRFAELHRREGILVMPNPWDVGTARLLASLGFEALATASAALAFSRGVRDGAGRVSRESAIAHAGEIVGATELPVNGDLENGFGDAPEAVAETVRAAIAAGLAGCSIEDSTGRPDQPLYDMGLGAERIAAARAAIEAAGVPFVLTARAECFLTGHDDPLKEATRRLRAYAAAGADVVYAPGLATADQIRAVLDAVDRPLNVLGGVGIAPLSVPEMAALGVKRVSLGPRLIQAALGAFLAAAKELAGQGTFTFMTTVPALGPLYDILEGRRPA